MPRSHFLLPLIAALLSGCGAEVVGTAVINGKLQAEQAEQAKAQADQLKLQLDEAMRATQAAASAANAQ